MMITFNSKKSIRVTAALSTGPAEFPVFQRPGEIEQTQGVTQQAKQLLTNVGEITRQKTEKQKKESPYGVFDLDAYQEHSSDRPGSVGGSVRVISSDMDGDRATDRDELGRPTARTLRDNLNSLVRSGEYTVMDHPMSALGGLPRVQNWLKAVGKSSLPVYIHKDHKAMIDAAHEPFVKYVQQENLNKNLAAAAASGRVFTSDTIKDVDDPSMRILSDPDGAGKAIRAFYTDQAQPLANPVTGVDYCSGCGSHRDNHDKSTCRNFLPMVVPDGSGGYMDGNEYRSSQSPLRTLPEASNDSLSFAQFGTSEHDAPELFHQRATDQKNSEPRTVITDSTPWFQRIFNIKSRYTSGHLPGKTLSAMKSKLRPCSSCNSTGKMNEARSGAFWAPEMLEGMHAYEPVTDPATGEKTLQKVSGHNTNDWAMRGTSPNICPTCDPRNVSDDDLDAFADHFPTTHGKLTADHVYNMLVENPGMVMAKGKPERPRTEGFIHQRVDQQPANPIISVSSPSTGAGLAYGQPDSSCKTCSGDKNYRKDGKPCGCSVADPSHFSLDNPVAPPGSPDYIADDGSLHLPPKIVSDIISEAYPDGTRSSNIFKLTVQNSERTIPNDQLSSPTAEFFSKEHKDSRDRKRGIARSKGRFGIWSSWVRSDGKAALDDEQQDRVIASMPSGVVMSPADKEEMKRRKVEIKSSPNAKERGASDQLSVAIDFLRRNIDRLPPTAGANPPIPSRAIRVPSSMVHVDPAMIAKGDIDLDGPAFGGAHPFVAPHIARIEKQARSLKRRKLISDDDATFGDHLQKIYGLSSDAARRMQDYGALSVSTPEKNGVSDQLFAQVYDMTNHLVNHYGKDVARSIMSPVADMVGPYLPRGNKLNA